MTSFCSTPTNQEVAFALLKFGLLMYPSRSQLLALVERPVNGMLPPHRAHDSAVHNADPS
jgi:hypothetical protein